MCRILVNKNNIEKFSYKELRESYIQNPDGTGLYAYDTELNKVFLKKWIKGTKFKEIAKVIQIINNNKKYKNVVIHFRFATSGKTDTDQIHPIQVKKNLYIAHNGVLSGLGDEVESDTQQFAKMLNVLDVDYKKLMEVDKYMKHIIGYNKIVVIWKDQSFIMNEDLGEWNKTHGIWKSWKHYEYSYGCYNYRPAKVYTADDKWWESNFDNIENKNKDKKEKEEDYEMYNIM